MPLSYAAAESLFGLGQFKDILSDVGDGGTCGHLPVDYRLLVADTLQRSGSTDAARTLVDSAVQGSLSDGARAKCERIAGLIARDLGDLKTAAQRLQQSSRIAREQGDLGQAGTSAMSAFRILSETQPPDVVGPLLADLRALTVRAGDPHLTALLHETVARHETQCGNFDEARRHLRIATGLIAIHPNAWLAQNCAINAFCIEFSACDFPKAQGHLHRAAALVAETASNQLKIANNEGHLELELGHIDRAERILRKVIDSDRGEIMHSALEGIARLFLTSGRLDECERALDRLRDLQHGDGSVMSFTARAGLVTRVRLRMLQDRLPEAAREADRAIDEGRRVSDRNMVAAVQFLKGQALARADRRHEASADRRHEASADRRQEASADGRHEARADRRHEARADRRQEASVALCHASDLGVWAIQGYQSAFALMTSEYLAGSDAGLSMRYRDRARRVQRAHRPRSASDGHPPAGQAAVTSERGADVRASAVANALASAFDLSYSPRLIADEMAFAIETLNCSPDVRVLEVRAEEAPRQTKALTLACGTQRGKQVVLSYQPPADPAKALVLGDVLRIGRAALALERYRHDERHRAALWPADPVEEQGGALFVAEDMQALLQTARRIASTNVPVLITGETGTGKEVLARTIHTLSSRAKATFLPFNCTSTPKDMLDSQLFGHRRGSFTGATEHFQGVIRASGGGTLFLDEIGDMGLEVQPKILRFLESGEVHPVGETHPQRVDVRVIAATNVHLDTLVGAGRFREDLFYRLNIVRLHVPPLRERRVEIPTLANYYLQRYAHECRKGDLRLAEDTMEYLVLYRWPGNVRQLANEMRRLAALAETGAVLMPEHLSQEIAASRRTLPPSERTLEATEVVVRLDQPMSAAIHHLERAMLQYALGKTGGRMEETAAMLGVSRKGLYLKRQRFGIDPPPERTEVA